MTRLSFFAIILSCAACCYAPLFAQPKLCVLVTSYNNERYCEENIASIAKQTYPHFRIVYVNDCSTDQTGPLVEKLVARYNLKDKCSCIHNTTRKGALQNQYEAIHKVDPNEVIVTVDGDDQLTDPSVLSYIASLYDKDPDLWLTYGDYISKPNQRRSICREYPAHVVKKHAFRSYSYLAGHLRTFYAGLYQQIKKKDLLEDGQFLPAACDVATMVPCIEMAAKGHFKYIKRFLYIYNDNNPLNDFRKNGLLRRYKTIIRSRKPYKPLDKAVWRK